MGIEKILTRISNEISIATSQMAGELFEMPLSSKQELMEALSRYDAEIEEVASRRTDIDLHLTHSISQACSNLLEDNWDSAGDFEKRLIMLACNYYIEEDDDEGGDFDSVLGFDDDAAVLNIVLENLEREDLIVLI